MCFPSKKSTCNKYEIILPIILHWVLHWKILDVHVIKNKYCKYMHAHTLQQMKASLKYMYSYINVYIYLVNIYKTINNQYAFSRSISTDQYHKLQLPVKPFIEHQLWSHTIVKLPVTRQEESSDQKNGDG